MESTIQKIRQQYWNILHLWKNAFIFSHVPSSLQGAGDRRMKNPSKQGLQGIYKWGEETEQFLMSTEEEVAKPGKTFERKEGAVWKLRIVVTFEWSVSEDLNHCPCRRPAPIQSGLNRTSPNHPNSDVAWPKILVFRPDGPASLLWWRGELMDWYSQFGSC